MASKRYERLVRYLSRALYPSAADGEFDGSWYLRKYPDVAEQFYDPWDHFVLFGDAEGRAPNAVFDPSYYARTHLALEESRPFRRYINTGRRFGLRSAAATIGAEESRAKLAEMLEGLRHPLVVVGSDAQRAGAPLLLLELAVRLRGEGFDPVFLLRRGGPLLGEHRAIGPVVVTSEGWDVEAMGAALPAEVPVLGSTGWAAPIIQRLGRASTSVLLVHEMPDYLARNGLLRAVRGHRRIVVGLPGVRDALIAREVRPEAIEVITPGLLRAGSSWVGRRRTAATIRAAVPRHGAVFLAAGYADERKGFDRFLDAAWAIAGERPDSVFVWLGDLSTWARRLADDSTSRGLRLLAPGFRTDAGDWYRCADVYLLTSRQDPGPTTVVDAAAAGVPFVGYRSDIGLRSLGARLDGVGEFVAERADFVAAALAAVDAGTSRSRRHRARTVRRMVSLEGYTTALVEALDAGTPGGLAPRRTRATAATRLRRRVAATLLVSRVGGLGAILPFARQAIFRPEERDPRPRGRIPATAVITQTGALPPWTITERAEVAEVEGAAAVWLGSPALVRSLTVPTGLHIVRDPEQSVWPLVAAVQRASRWITTVDQYRADDQPEWLRRFEYPPPARPVDAVLAPAPVGYPLAPAGPVRLPRPIGVFLHVYYLDLARELAARIAMIDHPHHVYVSTDDERKAEQVRGFMPEATVRVFPNRGRDVYPKLFGYAAEHADHDVVLHLHTKRSSHAESLSRWSDHILDRLLPSTEGANAILRLFDAIEALGMVSPTMPPDWTAGPWWGANRPLAEIVTWGSGWPPLPSTERLRFPAGSMFWARSAALAPVQALAPPEEAFLPGVGGIDGTLAHAIERLVGVSCDVAGYHQLFVDAPVPAGWSREPMTTADVARMLRGL